VSDLRADVVERLAGVRERIASAGGVGVEVVAVTKGFGIDEVRAAHAAGIRAIGESYAQEAVAKLVADDARLDVELHFVGRLQRNKVRQLAGIVDVFASIDRRSLLDEVARRAPGARCLLQVDAFDEPGKGGCPPSDVVELCDVALAAGLRVEGLMAVGPTVGGPEAARPGFRAVRELTSGLGLRVCSMGMTDDLEVAVEEGATQVRIGSALFGQRPTRSRPLR